MAIAINPLFLLYTLVLVVGSFQSFVGTVKRLPAFAFLALQVYSCVSQQLSVGFLDTHPIYITESGTVSEPTFAWLRFLICNLAIFVAAAAVLVVLGERRLARRNPGFVLAAPENRRTAFSILAVVLGLQIVNLVITGKFALPGSEVDRYTYWTTYAKLKFLPTVFGTLMTFVPLVSGILLFMGIAHRKPHVARRALLTLVTYYILLFLHGQRFHGIIHGLGFVFGVYALHTVAAGKKLIQTKFVVFVGTLTLCLAVYGLASMAVRALGENLGASGALLYRVFVLQGHAYWNSDFMSQTRSYGTLRDLANGLEFTMDTVGAPNLMVMYFDRGVNFAVALPGTLMLIGGFGLALVGSVLYGILCGLSVALLACCVRQGRVLLAFPVAYAWQWVQSVYSYGSIKLIVEPKFIVALAAFGVYAFLHSGHMRHIVRRPDRI